MRSLISSATGGDLVEEYDSYGMDDTHPQCSPDSYEKAEGSWIVADADSRESPNVIGDTYEPLRIPGLHREFAQSGLDHESLRSFATSYGFLGDDTEVLARRPFSNDHLIGESVDSWRQWVLVVRTILELWSLSGEIDGIERLRRLLVVDRGGVGLRSDVLFDGLPEMTSPPFLFGLFHSDDVVSEPRADLRLRKAARLVALTVLNDLLEHGVRPVVLPPSPIRDLASLGRASRPGVRLVPYHLLGAITVLAADEIMGRQRPAIRCAGCGRYFTPSRRDQKHCDGACRVAGHRARNDKKSNA